MSISPLAVIASYICRGVDELYAPPEDFQSTKLEPYPCSQELGDKITKYVFTHFSYNVSRWSNGFLEINHLQCTIGD